MELGFSTLLGLAVSSATATWVVVLVVRDLAYRRGLLDVPNDRSSHASPTPRLGGLGILATVAGLTAWWSWQSPGASQDLPILLAVAGAVSLVSLLDDLRGLSAVARLAVHLAAAVLTTVLVGPLALPWPFGPDAAALLVAIASVFWVTGFINAFNFMDGTDGIAGTQSLVASAAWAAAGWWLDQPALAVLATVTAAASAAFLLHNWSPATIFMGDVGSAFLGYLLAVLPLLASPRPTLWVALLPVWPFVADTALTLVRRWRRGESLMTAHRSHLYQRLTAAGWTHAGVALLYGGLAVPGAALAVLAVTGRVTSPLPGLTVVGAGTMLLAGLTARSEARTARPR